MSLLVKPDRVRVRHLLQLGRIVSIDGNQLTLDFSVRQIAPIDPNVDGNDVVRLSGQNRKLFEILRERESVTNSELANRFLKYTSRISDIRKWLENPLMDEKEFYGASIECERLGGSLHSYKIVRKGPKDGET